MEDKMKGTIDTAAIGEGKLTPAILQGSGIKSLLGEEAMKEQPRKAAVFILQHIGKQVQEAIEAFQEQDVQKPYPNEHAARMRDPADFIASTFRSKEIAPGIRIIMGKLTADGPMETQAYRFDKDKFTSAEARTWLKDHDLKPISFEEAVTKADDAATDEVLSKGYYCPIIKMVDERREVTAIVLKPETVDAQGDVISKEVIERTAHRFMSNYRKTSELGYMHRDFGKDMDVVESYIAPAPMMIVGKTVPEGSWVMTVKVNDDTIWAEVKAGLITGFSIGGVARASKPASV